MSSGVLIGVEGATTTDAERGDPKATDVPERVGRYVVVRKLGEGGMGIVFEAIDPELDRRVAIKLLTTSRRGQVRLVREAQVMARVSHPNVVQVYDVGIEGGRVFFAMELIRGRTATEWLRERRRAWPEIVALFIRAGRGLQAAHTAGIVHRDFKPDNILIAHDGRVCVADFGVARYDADSVASERSPPASSSLHASLTSTGVAVGTPYYMAPEQHAGGLVDARADQFSFCVALHEAIFRQRLLRGGTPGQVADAACHGRFVEPEQPELAPGWMRAVLRRGLSPAPGDRFDSFDALLGALEPTRRRAIVPAVLAGILVVAAGSFAIAGTAGDACSGSERELEESWGTERRAAVSAAYESAADGDLDGALVVRQLDDYAEAWVGAHRSACLRHADGDASDAHLDIAMACLRRGRQRLGRLADLAATGDPVVLADASTAAVRLPAPAACDNESDEGRPADPATARDVAELRGAIAMAEVVHHAGALDRALEELDEIRPRVDATGFVPLQAELALVGGRLAMDRKDWVLADRRLGDALTAALETGLDVVAAEAAARRIFVEAMRSDDLDRILLDAPLVVGLVHRAGSPPVLEALLANNLGAIHGMEGHREEAARLFEQALALADGGADVDPVDQGNYLVNLALVTDDPDERGALFVRASSTLRDALGEHHLRMVELAILRARYLDDPRDALALLAPACTEVRRRLPQDEFGCHACASRVGELYEQLGEPRAAAAALRIAAACFDAELYPEEIEHAQALRQLSSGHAALLEGDPAHALEELDAARRGLEPRASTPWIAVKLDELDGVRARAEGLLHDSEHARTFGR